MAFVEGGCEDGVGDWRGGGWLRRVDGVEGALPAVGLSNRFGTVRRKGTYSGRYSATQLVSSSFSFAMMMILSPTMPGVGGGCSSEPCLREL